MNILVYIIVALILIKYLCILVSFSFSSLYFSRKKHSLGDFTKLFDSKSGNDYAADSKKVKQKVILGGANRNYLVDLSSSAIIMYP